MIKAVHEIDNFIKTTMTYLHMYSIKLIIYYKQCERYFMFNYSFAYVLNEATIFKCNICSMVYFSISNDMNLLPQAYTK